MLKSTSTERLKEWLDKEMRSSSAVAILTNHIRRKFPDAPFDHRTEDAKALLATSMRCSTGLIRSDLYYNWRCANRGSVPSDLIDDMYHVLNAVYCDVYATAEMRQPQIAKGRQDRKTFSPH